LTETMIDSISNHNLRILVCCLLLLLLVPVGSSAGQEQEDFCCLRLALFVPIPMPSEQERDASGMISAAWYSALRESNILDCPIVYEELQRDERETEKGTEEYSEEILIEGKFTEELPMILKGTKDEIKETPPEFQEFLRDIAGDVSGKIRWKVEMKGEHW
jgi:hypothetical protein